MRSHRILTPAGLLLACLVALAACASPDPVLYAIGVQDGPTVSGASKTVELRDIGLAGYLDRQHIVLGSDGYRLQVLSNDSWGEPLGGMIGRVLAVELAQRLPGSNVYSGRSSISLSPDAIVEVNIQRMDAGADGNLALLAQVAVKFTRKTQPVVRTFTISRPLAAVTPGNEVPAISSAVGELADGIASMLAH
jgi:uncharacterized lipoprotein YmbA